MKEARERKNTCEKQQMERLEKPQKENNINCFKRKVGKAQGIK